MPPSETFLALLRGPEPVLALAPMQDVTDLAFWRVMARYGGADVYWTEYFRVHADSRLEGWILDSITQNPTGRPVIAQMIGNDVPSLVRAARELQHYPVAAIDLNLGCPAPVVYRKCAGGGLLREPAKIDAILGALREAVSIPFTVKTRIGFDSPAPFDGLLALFAKHSIDLLTVHGRTVAQMYRPGIRYDLIAQAARELPCPVLANGNVHGPDQAAALLGRTGARGLMIGRGAIRNPWLFGQIPAAATRGAGHAAHGTGSAGLHSRTVGGGGHAGRARGRASATAEKVHELHRRRRGAGGTVFIRNQARDDAGRFFCGLREASGSRWPDDAGTGGKRRRSLPGHARIGDGESQLSGVEIFVTFCVPVGKQNIDAVVMDG